jgi:hypothetical protein
VWKGPPWLTVGRDLVCLVLGVWGVVREELSRTPDLTRMGFFAMLILAPAGLGIWWLGRTGSPSSQPAPESPPTSRPSS